MLPINPVVNSKLMISSGQYQLTSSRSVEDKWLLKYCRDYLGMTWQESWDLWLPIFRTRHNGYYPEEEEAFFWEAWEYSKDMRFNADRDIVFYQNETSRIKSSNLPLWLKKFSMVLYSFFKALGASKISIGKLKIHQLARGTGAPSLKLGEGENSLEVIFKPLKKAKVIRLLSMGTVVALPEFESSEAVFGISTILEIYDHFDVVSPTKICPLCGAEFPVNSKTKRDICLSCWREKEAIRARNYRRTRKNGFFVQRNKNT